MRLFRCACTLALVLASGCSAVQPLGQAGVPPIPSSQCSVTVYATEAQARRHGEIEEACIIEGTSSGSFVHTPDTAIAKHKNKACGCGVDNVYVQSRQPMGMGVASVSMVAFRYVEGTDPELESEVFRKARVCQERDGVWVNDSCMIEID
jgi:hypothetical protein